MGQVQHCYRLERQTSICTALHTTTTVTAKLLLRVHNILIFICYMQGRLLYGHELAKYMLNPL
jgi:hypothetical protein